MFGRVFFNPLGGSTMKQKPKKAALQPKPKKAPATPKRGRYVRRDQRAEE
jgi:hypothetical protein